MKTMTEITLKVRAIYNVTNLEESCNITIDTLLVFSPNINLDLKYKVLRRENMEATVISTRNEDNVNFGLLLNVRNNSAIHLHENLTFTVHETILGS